jgi:hypothetical protein
MIQGSLSMDDEVESNCTIILPGMHRHIERSGPRSYIRLDENSLNTVVTQTFRGYPHFAKIPDDVR